MVSATRWGGKKYLTKTRAVLRCFLAPLRALFFTKKLDPSKRLGGFATRIFWHCRMYGRALENSSAVFHTTLAACRLEWSGFFYFHPERLVVFERHDALQLFERRGAV